MNSLATGDSVFDRLNKKHYKEDKAKNPPESTLQEQDQVIAYFKDVLGQNSTRPAVIESVQITGGSHTRTSFLEAQIQPILQASGKDLRTVVESIDKTYSNLSSFDIFDKINFILDQAPETFFSPTGSTLNIRAILNLKEAKRVKARTGTDLGNGEGNGYANLSVKSLFGGAETLSLDATIGTRTRSSYLANFSSPINNSPVWRGEALAYMSSRSVPWASHEQMVRGLTLRLSSSKLNFGYEAVWRTMANVSPSASDSIRFMAGDNIKTALFYNWTHDTRDSSLLATRGGYFKLSQEVAGLLGSEKGDRPFLKSMIEGQLAFSLDQSFLSSYSSTAASPYLPSVPSFRSPFSPVSLAYLSRALPKALAYLDPIVHISSRAGLLWSKEGSHLMDRFFLGGPNDVRGFYLNGMGPRDGVDSLGGEAFLSSGISLFTRVPRISPETPLKFQWFINGGSLLALNKQDPCATLKQLLTEPSIAAGFGLVYKHPVARFELNVTMPLVARELEGTRKGLQFGVGLSFL